MLEHDDQMQDKDMIKSVLQKIIDEMNSFEADRIMPEDKKPKAVMAEVKTVEPMEPEELESAEGGLSPDVLAELMSKAETADEAGSLPEDEEDSLPPEIAALVREKKKVK
jgi:hypothetical protein